MKDFCTYVQATNGELVKMSGTMKELEDLNQHEQDDIVNILAKLIYERVVHPPPFCRICLQDTCPALLNKGECPAERPLRWLAKDRPRKRKSPSPSKKRSNKNNLNLEKFIERL